MHPPLESILLLRLPTLPSLLDAKVFSFYTAIGNMTSCRVIHGGVPGAL